jgi:hypothetical protein
VKEDFIRKKIRQDAGDEQDRKENTQDPVINYPTMPKRPSPDNRYQSRGCGSMNMIVLNFPRCRRPA